MENLATFTFVQPEAAMHLRGELTDLAQGSRNLLPLGKRQLKPFKGLNYIGKGSRQLFILRNGYGGLNDLVVGGIDKLGGGSLFSHIGDSVWFCGQGKVSINGVEVSAASASSLLRVLLKVNNSYTSPKSGPFIVGLPEPSTPIVGQLDNPPGDAPQMNGNYVLQYARLSNIRGRSRASASTPIFNIPLGKGAYVVVPLPTTNTQTHVFFLSEKQTAGLGRTLRLSRSNPYTKTEYVEADVQRTISATAHGTDILDAPSGTYTQADIGKRVNSLTSGIVTSNPTTIITVLSDSQVKLSNAITGSGACSVELISYVNGIDRAVALNWKESELTSELAWIYDFPPPPCSHAFALGKRIYLICYPDSLNDASSDETGTALVPSLPNQLESFDLRYPLYLSERVIDVQTRQMASYVFLGCANGIYIVQETGAELTPATVSAIIQGEGIKHSRNWGFSKNALYVASADGKIIRLIGNGEVDTTFADSIKYLIDGVAQEDMVIGADPRNDGMTLNIKGISLFFDETTGRWSTELFLNDSAPGVCISAVGANSKLLLTMEEVSGEHKLYEFDKGNPSDTLTLSPYVATNGEFQKVINRFAVQFACDKPNETMYFAVHANNLQTHVKSALASENTILSLEGEFNQEMRGYFALIRGAGLSGGWHLARIREVINSTTLRLFEDVPVDVAAAYVLIARMIFPINISRKGSHQIESPELFINDLTSFAVSCLMETNGKESQMLRAEVSGAVTGEQWHTTGAVFGFPQGDAPTDFYEEISNAPVVPTIAELSALYNSEE